MVAKELKGIGDFAATFPELSFDPLMDFMSSFCLEFPADSNSAKTFHKRAMEKLVWSMKCS